MKINRNKLLVVIVGTLALATAEASAMNVSLDTKVLVIVSQVAGAVAAFLVDPRSPFPKKR